MTQRIDLLICQVKQEGYSFHSTWQEIKNVKSIPELGSEIETDHIKGKVTAITQKFIPRGKGRIFYSRPYTLVSIEVKAR